MVRNKQRNSKYTAVSIKTAHIELEINTEERIHYIILILSFLEKICTIISLPGHWSVITVLVEQKRIEYYDHYNRNSEEGRQCLWAMKQWVADEVKDKQGGKILDMRDWECEDMSCKIPIYAQQTDAHSCGPFAVRCLELITSNLLWVQARWYSQEDMQVYYRNRGLVAIYRGKCDC